MRFYLAGKSETKKIKSRFFGIFTETETKHSIFIVPEAEHDTVANERGTYMAHFGSPEMFSIAKGFATLMNSRFRVIGLFYGIDKSAASSKFVKINNTEDIATFAEEFGNPNVDSPYNLMRAVVLRDIVTGEKVVVKADSDVEIIFSSDNPEEALVNDFNKDLLSVVGQATRSDDWAYDLDNVFSKNASLNAIA